MLHRIAIGILFAESIAFAGSDMIDRLLPGLFPWVHLAIIGTSTVGLVWALWPFLKLRFAAKRPAEDRAARKRPGEPTFFGAVATLIGFIFVAPWVIAALMSVLYASLFLFQFVTSGFDLTETKAAMDQITGIAADQMTK